VSSGFPTLPVLEAALRTLPEPELAGAELEAAVLVCLHEENVLLVQRGRHEGDRWSGHVGLPGGRHEPDDATLLRTALRETWEEVGFHAAAHGRVLGAAGTWLGRGPWPGAVRIAIYVAALERRPPISLSHELTDAYWIETGALVPTTASVAEKHEPVPAYVVPEGDRELVVWGITYRILERLRALGAGPVATP
jgi:8-oxo-dGTP pyrophosphatase MutT (NUDIX family)